MVTLYSITNDPLYNIVPNWILDNTRTEIKVPERVCATCTGGWATNPSKQPTKLVKIGSNPEPGVIVLHPDYYKPRTATGEALRAHELYHIWQRSVYPNFKELFAQAADETEAAGLEPWENPYEKPAYEFEQQVKEYLLAQGYRD